MSQTLSKHDGFSNLTILSDDESDLWMIEVYFHLISCLDFCPVFVQEFKSINIIELHIDP